MDILGTLDTLLAFVVVILLFSIIVMTLSQATQSFLRLRGRYLRLGLKNLLVEKGLAEEEAKILIDNVLQKELFGTSGRLEKTKGKLQAVVLGNPISVLKKDEIGPLIQKELAGLGKKAPISTIKAELKKVENFARVEDYSKYQFKRSITVISVLWSFFIAFSFQISTPQLLKDFSTDPELRLRALEAIPGLEEFTEGTFGNVAKVEDVTDQALAQLTSNHPEIRDLLEEASGIGGAKEYLLEELELILEGVPNRAAIIKEYEALVSDLYEDEVSEQFQNVRLASEELSRMNIEFWKQGWEFYNDSGFQFGNFLGVLMTTLLLSLGAPFWYERLKELASLRSVFARGERTDRKGTK